MTLKAFFFSQWSFKNCTKRSWFPHINSLKEPNLIVSTLCESRLWIPILYWKLRFVYFKYHIISIVFKKKYCFVLYELVLHFGNLYKFCFRWRYAQCDRQGGAWNVGAGICLATIYVFRRCDDWHWGGGGREGWR